MNKIMYIVAALLFGMVLYGTSIADTGWEGATRIERGSYISTKRVEFTDSAATVFLSATVKRPDGICKNYSAYTVFIGSAAAGTSLRDIGLPVGASEYFKIDGSYTGEMSVIAEAGGSGSMACLESKVQ